MKEGKGKKEALVLELLGRKREPTFKAEANGDLLKRLEKFLPQIRDSNEVLQAQVQAGKKVDIEDVDETEEHIEMNLDVGVFDIAPKDDGPVPAVSLDIASLKSKSSSSSKKLSKKKQAALVQVINDD